MVKIKDIYDLFDVVLNIYVDGKFIASSIDIDSKKDDYVDLLNNDVEAITVGDCEVAIEC